MYEEFYIILKQRIVNPLSIGFGLSIHPVVFESSSACQFYSATNPTLIKESPVIIGMLYIL